MVAPPAASALTTPKKPPTLFAAVKCPPGWAHPKDYKGDEDNATCCPKDAAQNGFTCFMGKYVNPLINFLSALVGIVVLASVIFGGIQYSTAGGDPSKVAAARQRIINSLLALAAFIFLYAFLQWIIPGGI